jgi:hypothetical protein
MGFMDEHAGGGGPPLLKWNGNEGKYLKCRASALVGHNDLIV